LFEDATSSTPDNKYWTADFTDPAHGTNPDTAPSFDPTRYYRMTINDNNWGIGAYGNGSRAYWVLRGMPISSPVSDETASSTEAEATSTEEY
jgi:hypothetical protein